MKGDVVTMVRRLVAAAVIAPIVSVFTVFIAASPAWAVARLDAPSRVTSNQTVTLSGTVDHLFDAVLFVDGRQVAKGDRKVFYAWRPWHHRNGSHRIRLEQKGKVLGAEWHRTNKTLVQVAPPVTPGGPTVRLRGQRVVLTWRKGPEPDLRRYEITASRTGKVGSVEVRSACSGRVCGATITVPANVAGRRIGFTVRALRSDGAGGTVASGDSATTSVTFPSSGEARQGRRAGDAQNSDVRSGTIGQKPGDRNSARSGGEPNAEDENGGEQARVRDLPRLPPREAVATASEQTRTASGPREPSGTSAPEDGRAIASTGQETMGEGADQESREGATEPSGSGADGTTGATGAGDLAAADQADATTRSPDSTDGGMSLYGVIIAGVMVLLLAGAHGGAWFRRRSLITGKGTAEVNDVTTSSAAGSFPGDGYDGERGDGHSPAVAVGQAAETSAAGRIRKVSRALMAGGNGQGGGGAGVTIAPERPAVILAVVKTDSIRMGPSSTSPALVSPVSPDRIAPAPPPSDRATPAPPPSDRATPGRASSDRATPDRVAPDPSPLDQATSDRATSDREALDRSALNRKTSDREVSDSALPDRARSGWGAFGARIQPISVRPASLRLAAVRVVSSPSAAAERSQDARRQTHTEQLGKTRRQADVGQRGEAGGREEPTWQAERKSPREGQADFSQVPVRPRRTEQAQDTHSKVPHSKAWRPKAGQVRADQGQSPVVRVRATWTGMTRDEVMQIETVRNKPGPVEPLRTEHGRTAEPVQAEPVQAERVQAELVRGETVRTRRGKGETESGKDEAGKGDRQKGRTLRNAWVPSPGTNPETVPPQETNAASPSTARVADRWDDYLPPAPRSMEDSGFWGRPQPGATDFWGDDRHARDE